MVNDPKLSKLDANQVLRNTYNDETNELRVAASVTTSVADLDISIDAEAGDNIAITDPSGTNYLLPNADGSLNVVVTDSGLTTKNFFSEVDNVASGITVEVFSYTAAANTNLLSVDIAGTNVGTYLLYIGGVLAAKKYTYFTSLNGRFEFGAGLPVQAGAVISVEAFHARPDPGSFNVNVLIKN